MPPIQQEPTESNTEIRVPIGFQIPGDIQKDLDIYPCRMSRSFYIYIVPSNIASEIFTRFLVETQGTVGSHVGEDGQLVDL
jgi:hypothetical protein